MITWKIIQVLQVKSSRFQIYGVRRSSIFCITLILFIASSTTYIDTRIFYQPSFVTLSVHEEWLQIESLSHTTEGEVELYKQWIKWVRLFYLSLSFPLISGKKAVEREVRTILCSAVKDDFLSTFNCIYFSLRCKNVKLKLRSCKYQ